MVEGEAEGEGRERDTGREVGKDNEKEEAAGK